MIMERVPRTGLSVYRQSVAPAPLPDLPTAVASTSAEPVLVIRQPAVVPAVVCPHVAPTHTAQMALFAQAMCSPAQVVQLWAAVILRNAYIYT
jgi:hypothetical protein